MTTHYNLLVRLLVPKKNEVEKWHRRSSLVRNSTQVPRIISTQNELSQVLLVFAVQGSINYGIAVFVRV